MFNPLFLRNVGRNAYFAVKNQKIPLFESKWILKKRLSVY